MGAIDTILLIGGTAFGVVLVIFNKSVARHWRDQWYFLKGDNAPLPIEEKYLQILARAFGAIIAFVGICILFSLIGR